MDFKVYAGFFYRESIFMELRAAFGYKDFRKIKKLYMRAFPANERKPLSVIRYKQYKKAADVWMIEEEDTFVGMAVTMNGSDLVLLDYFAIDDEYREKGFGSKALQLLQKKYGKSRFFLEIERTDVVSDNLEERKRRKFFYLKNNMSELNVYADLFGVEMELLGYHCDVSFDEYFKLYVSNYGRLAEKNICQSKK